MTTTVVSMGSKILTALMKLAPVRIDNLRPTDRNVLSVAVLESGTYRTIYDAQYKVILLGLDRAIEPKLQRIRDVFRELGLTLHETPKKVSGRAVQLYLPREVGDKDYHMIRLQNSFVILLRSDLEDDYKEEVARRLIEVICDA